ncbi:hypothetical protein [Pseudaestuariivita sp.]|uniref:hypothetical protein n=1 Tax=Pseudaestuariivita sp. TaxID=2211669 RepID=UPI004057FAB6
MSWLARNAKSVEAVAAAVTACVAVAALVGVKLQLDAADALARAQDARTAFRAHLSLAVAHPQYAAPDTCALLAGPEAGAYTAFVEHLLYSAEQMLVAEDGWEETFLTHLAPHAGYLCSSPGLVVTPATAALLDRFEARRCAAVTLCSADG